MLKTIRKIINLIIILVIAGLLIYFAPLIRLLMGGQVPSKMSMSTIKTELINMGEILSLKHKEQGTVDKSELMLFNIPANNVKIDYELEAFYGIDLSQAEVKAEYKDLQVNLVGKNQLDYKTKVLYIYLPEPQLINLNLQQIGSAKKSDFLRPISEENIRLILEEVRKTKAEELSQNKENLELAFKNSNDVLQNLFNKITESDESKAFTIKIDYLKNYIGGQ